MPQQGASACGLARVATSRTLTGCSLHTDAAATVEDVYIVGRTKGRTIIALAETAFARLTSEGAWEKCAKEGVTHESLKKTLQVFNPLLISKAHPP